MKMRRSKLVLALVVTFIVAVLLISAFGSAPARPSNAEQVAAAPRLLPELAGVVLPPNLAAPGIRVDEPGRRYFAELKGGAGRLLTAGGRRNGLSFNLGAWRRLLAANAGGQLTLTIAVQGADGRWKHFAPVALSVAREPVDRYLAYRLLTPLYSRWGGNVGVYQRDLASYEQRTVLHGRQFKNGCLNCHTFYKGSGRRFSFGIRTADYGMGTEIVHDGQVDRLSQAVAYGGWHPNGQLLAYASVKVRQFYHQAGEETRDVIDLKGALVIYDVKAHQFATAPQLCRPELLYTYPTWSPDGRWLYYCATNVPWPADTELLPPPGWDAVHYSLWRVSFDEATRTFGEPQLIKSGDKAKRSLIQPRISPDGRWLLYVSSAYGCFPIHRPDADLGLIDLTTGKDVPVTINSPDRADTWHSWSRDGHWIVFSSKRADGLFTKPYLSDFDGVGHFSPPVQLPQKSPWFYDKFWYSYNVPELVAEPVTVSAASLGRAVRTKNQLKTPLPAPLAPPAAAKPDPDQR